MSRVLYYDCFAGISGDMNLAALIALGVPAEHIRTELAKLGMPGEFELHVEPAIKNGISGTSVHVHAHDHDHDHHGHGDGHHHHHRSFADIRGMIGQSSLDEVVKATAIRVFAVLAEAEGEVHGKPADEVHFHEVGAVDSIVDIVGAAIALRYLDVDTIASSAVELGSGTVRCAHGVMPVPAPATSLLSRRFPSRIGGTDHEATTPTGAAWLAALADRFEPVLSGRCVAVGIGIGYRDSDRLPNILRISLYETEGQGKGSIPCVIVEANIDDMTAEHLSHLTDQLAKAGAMDAWQQAIVMKKGRMGARVCALCSVERAAALRDIFLTHSTTLGVREIPVAKYELERDHVTRCCAYGEVRVKRGLYDGSVIKEKPEFDDCRALSDAHGVSIREITDTIQREY